MYFVAINFSDNCHCCIFIECEQWLALNIDIQYLTLLYTSRYLLPVYQDSSKTIFRWLHLHIFCSRASIFADFWYDWYPIFSLIVFLREKNDEKSVNICYELCSSFVNIKYQSYLNFEVVSENRRAGTKHMQMSQTLTIYINTYLTETFNWKSRDNLIKHIFKAYSLIFFATINYLQEFHRLSYCGFSKIKFISHSLWMWKLHIISHSLWKKMISYMHLVEESLYWTKVCIWVTDISC